MMVDDCVCVMCSYWEETEAEHLKPRAENHFSKISGKSEEKIKILKKSRNFWATSSCDKQQIIPTCSRGLFTCDKDALLWQQAVLQRLLPKFNCVFHDSDSSFKYELLVDVYGVVWLVFTHAQLHSHVLHPYVTTITPQRVKHWNQRQVGLCSAASNIRLLFVSVPRNITNV